jgi:hypothetical protein
MCWPSHAVTLDYGSGFRNRRSESLATRPHFRGLWRPVGLNSPDRKGASAQEGHRRAEAQVARECLAGWKQAWRGATGGPDNLLSGCRRHKRVIFARPMQPPELGATKSQRCRTAPSVSAVGSTSCRCATPTTTTPTTHCRCCPLAAGLPAHTSPYSAVSSTRSLSVWARISAGSNQAGLKRALA